MGDFANGLTADSEAEQAPFFVVSPLKLGVMSFATFGVYWLYCFYQSWKLHKAKTGEQISPFWRVFFACFFIYSLLRRVNYRIVEVGKSCGWSILGITLTYYALAVATVVVSFMLDGRPVASLLASLGLEVATVALFIAMQNGINLSAGDVSGQSNSRFTLSNWLWMLPGIALRLMMLFAMIEVTMV